MYVQLLFEPRSIDWSYVIQRTAVGKDVTLLGPHLLLRRDFVHGRQVDDLGLNGRLSRLAHGLPILPLDVPAIALSVRQLLVLLIVLVTMLLLLLLLLLLQLALSPDVGDLKIVALGGQVIHAVLAVPAQHADGQEDEQDQDESAGDGYGDGGGFEPQILGRGVSHSGVHVSVGSLYGNRPQFQTS